MPPNLSELAPYQISSGLTHLGSEASNWYMYTSVIPNDKLWIYHNIVFEIKNKPHMKLFILLLIFELIFLHDIYL